ncbi:hypothetical protein MIND_00966000 [Mycena indigotica]|uniref:Uncharacterized protein n=1 Tax=Mycena indigotica TaxID=2126181 RepID=A0A8H6SFB6_9AGAR|nr:uncharacterized protein MIND_00966000 [Mycena indigotica]KAF7297327.1 hypothetical protein MIND_00966000 [Mycena indigotica]
MQRIHRRSFYSNANYYKYRSPVQRPRKTMGLCNTIVKLPPNVQTFHPHQITPRHFIIPSQIPSFCPHFRQLARRTNHDPHPLQFGNQLATRPADFPEDARGFLYYYSPSDQNPIAGSLRFRLAKEATRKAFIEGSDLRMDHGIPWALPIYEIATSPSFESLWKILVLDGLAPPHMLKACEALGVVPDSVFIAGLGVPWAVDFSYEYSRLYICVPGMHPIPLMIRHPWFNRQVTPDSPVSGRAVLSIIQLSDSTYGLRINKILRLKQEIHVQGALLPEEGQVTPLRVRAVVRTTKLTEERIRRLEQAAVSPVYRLPWAHENPSPLDIYRHMPISLTREERPPPNGRHQVPPHMASAKLLSTNSRLLEI